MVTQKMCPLAYPNLCKWHGCIQSDADFIHILGFLIDRLPERHVGMFSLVIIHKNQ